MLASSKFKAQIYRLVIVLILINQGANATPPSVTLQEKFSIGPVNSAEDAKKLLAQHERQLSRSLTGVDIYPFTNASTYLKRHGSTPQHFKFYFKIAETKEIQPDCNFHYGKYYFPTNELYYQLRIPFITEPSAEAEVQGDKTPDEQIVPIVWLFVSKSGHVCSYW